MQIINIVIVGDDKNSEYVKNSKFVSKVYFAPKDVKFNTFRELAEKCKALKADIVIVNDEKWILQGVGDVLRSQNVNCVAPTSRWTKFGIERDEARKILEKYDFPLLSEIVLPDSFPVYVKGNGVCKKANSLNEIVKIREEIYNKSYETAKTIYLEEFFDEPKKISSLYDGKHLITFPHDELDKELILKYNDKLNNVLNSEKANFIGFINSYVVRKDDELYNTGFDFAFPDYNIYQDLIYILISALYQKLNEIELT